jgi:hypothetical protein
MKTVLSLVLLAALTTLAQAQANPLDKAESKAETKAPEKKGTEIKSPWSVDTADKTDGYFGSSSTTIKRDIGDGWAVGGKMTTPYQDQRIGGSGTPGIKQYDDPGSKTLFGPVLEKKF